MGRLEALQMLIKHNVGGRFGGNHKSKIYGSSCEFADYRDYAAGDDIKRIDWNAFGRFEELYLKLYLDERQMHTRIYIDASRSVGFDKKGIQAIRIAACIAYLSVCETDKVSIFVVREKGMDEVISGILGKDAYFANIGKLNEITFEGDSFISDAILPASVGYGDGMSVLISDFLTDNNFEDAIEYLTSKKRDVLCVQVLSDEELNPKVRGKVHLFDSESLSRSYRKNVNREIIKAYRMALDFATGRIRDYCALREADYLLAPASQPVEKLFFESLESMGVVK